MTSGDSAHMPHIYYDASETARFINRLDGYVAADLQVVLLAPV